MIGRAIAWSMAGIVVATIASAGSIGYNTISSDMDWEPDCYRPGQPSFAIYDRLSYNLAVDEFSSYTIEVQSYVECLSVEAESDLNVLARAIANRADERRSEILSDVESARSDLKLQTMLVE